MPRVKETNFESNKRKAVIKIDQAKSGILCIVIPGARMLNIVVIKFIAPKIEEAPARCIDNIAISIQGSDLQISAA